MNYNFKSIQSVPSSKDLINIVLSKTQRKTPTVIHPGCNISRIRGFYMRKVKFTQDTIHEKLSYLIDGFPKLEDIHPFYADLINVLYDKDHYKLALGHTHSCRNLVDNLAKDYVRLMKYADTLYRCKMLKKAALGRMCTILKKLNSSLLYLEEVRKHLARLPSINPFEKTLLITGYPNVGKSSFINLITHANVDVQPYPFTTQSLYVGHTDYNYTRWQVIDSPGILDHPLEQRNTIEMQSITALAHLKACIMFFIDISESCSYSIPNQISLFNNIKPLFKNKPVVIVLTKVDLRHLEELTVENQELLNNLSKQENITMVQLSNKSGEGVGNVKNVACQALLNHKSDSKMEMQATTLSKIAGGDNSLKGAYVAIPKKKDDIERPPSIPESIQRKEKVKLDRPTLKELEQQYGGAGVFNFPLQEHFTLDNPDWKYDIVPEIMDGKNIEDYVDKDILKRLDELEMEEKMLEKAQIDQMAEEEDERDLGDDMMQAYKEVVSKRAMLKSMHKLKRHDTVHLHQPSLEEVKTNLKSKGIDTQLIEQRVKNQKRKGRPLAQVMKEVMDVEEDGAQEDDDGDVIQDEGQQEQNLIDKKFQKKKRSMSRSRSKGFRPEMTSEAKAMDRMRFKIEKQWNSQGGRAGEADRSIPAKKPKHLFSGKRKLNNINRR